MKVSIRAFEFVLGDGIMSNPYGNVSRILCSTSDTCTIYVDEEPLSDSTRTFISEILCSFGSNYHIKKIIFLNNRVCLRTNLPYELNSKLLKALNKKS